MDNQTDNKVEFAHAREHLANERTFLAWIRTALAIIGLGFVVVKFSLFIREMEMVVSTTHQIHHNPTYSLPLGIILIALGGTITMLSYFRYLRTQKRILNSEFIRSSTLTKVTTLLLLVSCILLILYLWFTT